MSPVCPCPFLFCLKEWEFLMRFSEDRDNIQVMKVNSSYCKYLAFTEIITAFLKITFCSLVAGKLKDLENIDIS